MLICVLESRGTASYSVKERVVQSLRETQSICRLVMKQLPDEVKQQNLLLVGL